MLLFQSFDIEKSQNCQWDKLSIYEEKPYEQHKLGEFCGDSIPPTITSSKKVHIQFTSDTIIQNKGFKLQYKKMAGLTDAILGTVYYLIFAESKGPRTVSFSIC